MSSLFILVQARLEVAPGLTCVVCLFPRLMMQLEVAPGLTRGRT
jgi:hypothetical protein